MTTPRVALRTSGMRPVGFVGDDPHALAMSVKGRIRTLHVNNKGECLVVVIDDRVFATSTWSTFAAHCPSHLIVGVYTMRATANDIADDLREWLAGNSRKAA